jgi:hypothetical protein
MRFSQRFHSSVVIFGVIGIGHKSQLLCVEGMIDAERDIQNLSLLGLMKELDQIQRHSF